MNKIYLLTAMLLIAAAAMAGVSAPQRGPQKLAHGLPVPVVKPATNVSDAGFTANWEKVSGANCYTVYTYIRHKAPAAYALPTFACRIACGCNNTNLDNLYN